MKNRLIVGIALMVCLFSVSAGAETNWFGEYNLTSLSGHRAVPGIWFSAITPVELPGYQFSLLMFFSMVPGWGEAYFGRVFSPWGWLNVVPCMGFEQSAEGMRLRRALIFMAHGGRINSFAVVEWNDDLYRGGSSGWWYDLYGTANVLDATLPAVGDLRLNVGGRARRGFGLGPYVEVAGFGSLKLWLAVSLADPENRSGFGYGGTLVGLGWN